jgi:hypothetical protein
MTAIQHAYNMSAVNKTACERAEYYNDSIVTTATTTTASPTSTTATDTTTGQLI